MVQMEWSRVQVAIGAQIDGALTVYVVLTNSIIPPLEPLHQKYEVRGQPEAANALSMCTANL
jgi:hypothetical protein